MAQQQPWRSTRDYGRQTSKRAAAPVASKGPEWRRPGECEWQTVIDVSIEWRELAHDRKDAQ